MSAVAPAPPAAGRTRAGQIPSLDGMRAVAVGAVFLGHAGLPTYVGPATGVTIFFFLSGYLITTLLRMEHARTDRINLRDFYLRRALRILPPLYLALLLLVAVVTAGVVDGRLSARVVVAVATHTINYAQVFWDEDFSRGTGVFWSLAVEEHFYLLFPLLYLALLRRTADRRTHARVLGGICALILAWRCVLVFGFDLDNSWTQLATDARADSILLGCLFAVLANPVLDGVRVSDRTATWLWVPVGALVVAAVPLLPDDVVHSVGYTVQGVALAFVFTGLIAFPRSPWGRVLNSRPLVWIGLLSYGIYLFHRILQTVVEDNTAYDVWVSGALSLALTLAVCQLVHVSVERPCARLRRRLAHARADDAVRAGAAREAPTGRSDVQAALDLRGAGPAA